MEGITKNIKTVNNKEIKVVYSPLQKTTSAYVIEEGREQLIKPEDLPKELREVKDHASLQLLLENSYTRASYLSNGDVKLYMEQRGLGGGKEDRSSSYWQKLLSNIKELVEERAGSELGLKAFISYAWEDTSTDAGEAANGKLQRWLEGLRDDLQGVGVSVFLDIGDMHGDMAKRMRENLDQSDIILTINTPRYAQRATSVPQTNLGFEYELTLKKAEVNPKSVVTLYYEGELDQAYPETLKHFPRYDCRKLEDYSENLVGGKGLPGIIPTILGINIKEDGEYQNLVQQWRQEKLNYLPEENKEFVGRTEQLEKLEKALEAKPVQAISGREGIGKSKLALKYANDHTEQYKIVRWINAEPGNLKKEFKQIAEELGINTKGLKVSELVYTVYKHLESIPNWLLIFDNAMDRSTIEAYLPKPIEKGQHVIITSRSNEKWKGQVELKDFSKAEAWEYIHQKLPNISQSQAMELASKVQYLPIKIKDATDYINSTGISLPYYIKTHLSFKSTKTPIDSAIQTTDNEEDIAVGTIGRTGLTKSKTGNREQKDNAIKPESVTEKKNAADFPTLLERVKEKILPQIKKEQVKVYISYATDDSSTTLGEEKNEKVQNWLQKLQGSLEQAGMVVTTSSRDINGNIEASAEEDLKSSDAILLINTPVYKQQVLSNTEAGLGYEYKLILAKAKEIPYGILPLLYSGGFSESVPRELWGFLVRDCTNESAYEENLVAPQNPKGIIPGIYNIDCDDTPEYKNIVQEWRWHKASSLPAVNPNFLGREEVLAQLAKNFLAASDSSSQKQVVSATGGMGKSELAIVYANKHASGYDMVRWLNTEGDKLSLEFNQLATELGIDTKGMALKDLIGAVHRSLNEIPRYLLIFDNADNAAGIKDYLPPQNKVGHHVIITSRSSQWSNCIILDTFSPEECWKYIDGQIKDADKHYAMELAKNVGYLPLALSQAVAYINQEKMNIVHYLENYKTRSTEKGTDNVMGTWSMSMEKVKEKSPEAAFMLEVCSYLNPDNIPLTLFEHPGLLGDPVKVQEALRVLREYSLVQSSKVEDQIRVHRLVQAVTRHKEATTETPQKITKKVAKLKAAIESYYPKDKIKASDYEIVRDLLPHIESLAENLKPYANLVQSRSGIKELLKKFSNQKGNSINNDAAQEYAVRVSDKLNAGVILQAELLSMFSDGLYTLGEYSLSKEVLEKVVDIKKHYYGENTPEVAVTLSSLGITLREEGNYDKAQEILNEALEIQENHYSNNHPELCTILIALGTTLSGAEDYLKSNDLLDRAVTIKESNKDLESREMAIVLTSLANNYSRIKRYDKSKKLLDKALNIQERYIAAEHLEVASTLISLGNVLSKFGEYNSAKEKLERALRIQENYYGKEHWKVVSALTQLHDLLEKLEDHESSKVLLKRVILIKENIYGLSHPEVMSDILKLANAVGSIRDIDNTNVDSRTKLEESVKVLEQYYGANHLIVAVALGALSYQIQDIKDYAIRQSLLERVIQIKEYNYGIDHPKIISSLDALADFFAQLDNINNQKSILEKLLKIKQYYYGLDHVEVANTLDNLVLIANKEGNTANSRSLIEKSLKIKEGYYGKDHRKLIGSLESLEKIISDNDNLYAQKEILSRIVKIKDNYYKLGSDEILNTARKLQEVLRKLGNIEEQSENAGRILKNLSQKEDTTYIKVIIQDGDDIDTQNNTPLMWAAHKDHTEVALALIEKGANVNVKDTNGKTPLMWAVKNGHTEVALALIEKGANVNVKDTNGKTPLMWAAYNCLNNVILALIEKGANINVKDTNGKTPLMWAVKNGHTEVALALIKKGANVNDKDNEGKTPLMFVLPKCLERSELFSEMFLILMKKGAKYHDGKPPLTKAICDGHGEIALALIDKEANVNDKDNEGKTPLIWAAHNNYTEVALALIKKGANVNVKDTNGKTPLIWAAHNNHTEVALALIEKGANVNVKDQYGNLPLIMATSRCLNNVALALIEKGANINVKDTNGKTPLMWAVKNGHKEVALALIKKGANVNDKDNEGKTPLMLAAENGHKEVALALIDKGANVDDEDNKEMNALLLALKNQHKDLISILMTKEENSIPLENKSSITKIFSQKLKKPTLQNQVKKDQINSTDAQTKKTHNKKTLIVKAVTDIIYDNELLNHPNLLKESLKDFTLNQIIDMSLNLDQRLVDEAVNNNDSSLVLAGLISLAEENTYE